MKVTLITHSCVLIELSKCSLLFDYYDGKLDLNKDKPLYVFASHGHADHYSRKIFRIDHPDIHYILSDDIYAPEEHLSVSAHQHYEIGELKIDTLFSTDAGVAYIVEAEGLKIYFAGDLNDWYWEGEPQKDNDWQNKHYLAEMKRIKGMNFDLACIVVDDRQENQYLYGINEFKEYAHANVILPIHYFGHYRISKMLQKEKLDKDCTILYPAHDYSSWDL